MSYTALKKMREFNFKRFSKDMGPFEPDRHFRKNDYDLKGAALRFLHDRCEGLKFDKDKDAETDTGKFSGNSLNENQIPYNMQMDLNRLCLERELERFIDSGVADDAYNVYYCYMEMFFGNYGKSKKMVELLSEFESNGSSLLMKHRDHYSHSVYVFALGLALYETNSLYRAAFKRFYGFDTDDENKEQDHKAACTFLEYWGLASLFHDIGYPFELPFEQVLSYFEVDNKERGKGSVYIAYQDVSALTKMPFEVEDYFNKLYERVFRSTSELFAFDICEKLENVYGISEPKLLGILENKPLSPNTYGYFMDHAWFSAARLFQELTAPEVTAVKNEDGSPVLDENGREKKIYDYSGLAGIGKMHIDALTAILLHNSLFKFSIAFYKEYKENGEKKYPALSMDQHPLAYMLMLCDELQCWDRTAYGRNSRTELHPMSAEFDFSKNNIKATYIYDAEESEKIDKYKEDYKNYLINYIKFLDEKNKRNPKWTPAQEKKITPKPPKLKAYGSMYEAEQSFRTDIEKIVDVNTEGGIRFSIALKTAPVDRSAKHTYLSVSSFLHLYDFALALNARYNYEGEEDDVSAETIEKDFSSLSLEYKLSNINQAKAFSKYLNAIGCFYTDKPVDFMMVDHFTPDQTEKFAPMEHKRWVIEHRWMGWTCGDFYETEAALAAAGGRFGEKELREQLRMHKLAMDGNPTDDQIKTHYDGLSDDDKGKDWKPFNSMLKLIRKFDGLRIYKLDS